MVFSFVSPCSYLEIDKLGANRYEVAIVYRNFSANATPSSSISSTGKGASLSAWRLSAHAAIRVAIAWKNEDARERNLGVDGSPCFNPTALVSEHALTSKIARKRSILHHRLGHEAYLCGGVQDLSRKRSEYRRFA